MAQNWKTPEIYLYLKDTRGPRGQELSQRGDKGALPPPTHRITNVTLT